MAKLYAQALRGLRGAFGLAGQKVSPQELELELAVQPVADMTAPARYGAADFGALGDGWFTWSFGMSLLTGAGFYNTNFPLSDAEIRADSNLWVYDAHILITSTVDADDVTSGIIFGRLPEAAQRGASAATKSGDVVIMAFEPTNPRVVSVSATVGIMRNAVPHSTPICLPPGSTVGLGVALGGGAADAAVQAVLYCRALPQGVPALP